MLKRTIGIMVVGLILLSALSATAAGSSRWRWWQNTEIIQQLKLTEDEIKQLNDAYLHLRSQWIDERSRIEAERFKLEELLGQLDFSEDVVRSQHRKLEEARSKLAEKRFDFLLQSRKIIGHERFQKLTEIQRKWREERRKKWEAKSKAEQQQPKGAK